MDIPDFRKQFTTVCVDSASQTETNICIWCSNKIFKRLFFFSTLWIIFRTTFLRYFAFNEQITPWSIGWVSEVVLGDRNYNLLAFRLSIWGWAGAIGYHKSNISSFKSKLPVQLSEPFFKQFPTHQTFSLISVATRWILGLPNDKHG